MATLSWDQDEYIRAYRFAAEAHNSRKIQGTDLPYIIHPGMVAMELMAALQVEPQLDGDLLLKCALLHDVIEDTDFTFEDIRTRFGDPVARGVSALSKNELLPEDERMTDCLKRIQQQPREVRMVKLADRISNLQPPPKNWSLEKIRRYRDEAILIQKTLSPASDFLANRLTAKIQEYERYCR